MIDLCDRESQVLPEHCGAARQDLWVLLAAEHKAPMHTVYNSTDCPKST